MSQKKRGMAENAFASVMPRRFEYVPFDPQKHTPQDVGLGGLSTEYLATEFDENGRPFNFPTIWFDGEGRAHKMPTDQAMKYAIEYERQIGRKFPRFDSIDEAVRFAKQRSRTGGAEFTPLMSYGLDY